MTLSFIEFLETRLRDAPPKLKGERTRARLMIATAKVLEQKGYHAMRLKDVTDCAELAEGAFYIYFRDKLDAALTVLTALLEEFISIKFQTPARSEGDGPFVALRWANRQWITVSRANSGLMRCLQQLGDDNSEFSLLVQRTNSRWRERIFRSLSRRSGPSAAPALGKLAVYLLGAMMVELVRKLIVYPDPDLQELMKELNADDEVIADATSVVWLRILYPSANLPEDLPEVVLAFADNIGVPPILDRA